MKRKFLFAMISLIFLTIATIIYLYVRGTAPLEEKYQEALARAQDVVQFSSVEHIDWFHYEEAYTIIEGRDQEGTRIIVWVPENEEGEITAVKASDGLRKEDALALLQTGLPDLAAESRPREILSIKYGMIDKNPVFEITYLDQRDRYSILYLDFYAGEWFKVYNL